MGTTGQGALCMPLAQDKANVQHDIIIHFLFQHFPKSVVNKTKRGKPHLHV